MTGAEGALVGRAHERAVLSDMLARAESGEPAFVTLIGEAGMGKTTLADELAREARARGMPALRGAARDVDHSTLAIWRGPMRALGVDLDALELTGGDRRWEALGAIADALDGQAPVAVVLDDLHWADELGLWILDHLPATLTRGVAMLATTRPVDRPRRMTHVGRVVPLQGLSVDEVVELSSSHGHASVDGLGLHARTAGNPLFVLELLASPHEPAGVPEVIDVALGYTLDRLSPPARHSLAVLALAGAQTPLALIAAAADVSAASLRDHFDEGVRHGVLVAPSVATVQFRHDLFAETLLGRVPPGERRALHAALSDAWRAAGGADGAFQAAAHGVLSVPHLDATMAAREALAAGRILMKVDPSSAQRLFADAVDVLEQYAPAEARLRAELLLELGEVHLSSADWVAASDVFEGATALTAALDDPLLHARAEALAARHMSMFEDDPVRRDRLTRAADGLPSGDHPLRAELLGRLSVAELGRSELWESARHHADEAVAIARRIGEPDAIAKALIDRHLAALDRDDIEARAGSADELMALGEAAHHPERVLVGLEWRYGAAMAHGDVAAAKAVLDRAEVLAAVMPSPEWTYSVLLRRALIAAIDGEHSTAQELLRRAVPLGRRALWAGQALGLEVAVRILICRITGVPDPELTPLHHEFEQTPQPRIPYFLLHSAAGYLAIGEVDTARAMVQRVAEQVCRAALPAEFPSTILLLGELVAELGLRQYSDALRRLCEPFRGYLTTEQGFAVSRPADMTLAELALLADDAVAAGSLMDGCLELVRALPSPAYEARALWLRSQINERLADRGGAARDRREAELIARRTGVVLPGSRPNQEVSRPAARASLVRRDAVWTISSPHGDGRVPHSIGMDQLARVLAAAPHDVLATDLTAGEGPVAVPLGSALDTAAKHAYRRRINELNAEIDEADRFNDLDRASRARVELDALMQELRRAVGLRGRDRPMGSGAERARVNVARSLRRAISAVRTAVPGLGAHLEVSVRTGRVCCYAPEPSARLDWEVQRR